MTISMIKLVSGDTLLAEVINHTETQIVLNNPISVIVKVRHAPVMMSHIWMPFDEFDNHYHIEIAHIITEKEVDEEMVLYYNKCIDTIHDNMTSTESLLPSAVDEEDPEDRFEKLRKQLEEQYHVSANTVIH
jgi:hypothetical protein